MVYSYPTGFLKRLSFLQCLKGEESGFRCESNARLKKEKNSLLFVGGSGQMRIRIRQPNRKRRRSSELGRLFKDRGCEALLVNSGMLCLTAPWMWPSEDNTWSVPSLDIQQFRALSVFAPARTGHTFLSLETNSQA
ncbi:hypothetical protein SDJN02_02145, partial [Cucurbita argyrosperma subsp. argyrosperma]